jgi:hypothetical protein
LNGAIAACAERLALPAPVNRALAEVLVALTNEQAQREAWRHRPDRLAALMQASAKV